MEWVKNNKNKNRLKKFDNSYNDNGNDKDEISKNDDQLYNITILLYNINIFTQTAKKILISKKQHFKNNQRKCILSTLLRNYLLGTGFNIILLVL